MKKIFAKMDKWLLFFTVLYAAFGLIMIYSASSVAAVLRYNVSSYHFFINQLFWIIAGFVVGFVIVLKLPTSKYRLFIPILVIGMIAALAGLFVYGFIAGGAQRWYNFGFFNFQPTEFAKAILIIYMAVYYDKLMKRPKKDVISFFIPIAIAIIFAALIVMQPDLGSAFVVAMISFFVFISLPVDKKMKMKFLQLGGIGAAILIVILMVGQNSFLNPAQMARFNFRNPCTRYTDPSGYQLCNGFIAINNAKIFGVGLGNSTQKYMYLPEGHTDFIFPIIVEELGLIVGILIILGYAFMLYRILKIARNGENLRCSLLAYGVFWLMLLHILINLLGILGLMPLTGIPLPLLSYGGSFSIVIIVMLFIVQKVAVENAINKNKREIANM